MTELAAQIQAELRALADPATASLLQRFFKTGAGQYAAGDQFLGIKVPVLRAQVKRQPAAGLDTLSTLLNSVWHEERLCALLLLIRRYRSGDRQNCYDFYLAHTQRINNWDLVDVSAPHIVGDYLLTLPRDALYRLVESDTLWDRRIAIVATLQLIRARQFADTLALAERLLNDRHDLMHKAVGWMLREVGKRDLPALETFLQTHYRTMPRTMLRYAIERLPESRRQAYLNGKI